MVSESARLGRAPARARDRIPALGQIDSGLAGHRIDVDHRPAGPELIERHVDAARARQLDVGHPHPGEMIGGAVVLRDGQVGGQAHVVGHGVPCEAIATAARCGVIGA